MAPLSVKGVGIKSMHGLPKRIVGLVTVHDARDDTLLGDTQALAFDLLALARLKAVEKVIEVSIVVIVPVVLATQSQHQAAVLQAPRISLVGEQPVDAREPMLFRQPDGVVDESVFDPLFFGACVYQEPRPSYRRVGNRRYQLRVIVHAVALISGCPRPIEDELPIGISLDVQGCGADQCPTRIPCDQVSREPAEARAQAVLTLKRDQKLMA
jgi:hypothetical protein